MKEFLEYIAKALVDEPDAVDIVEEIHDERLVLKLKVAKPDMGKIIGKKGRTAFALRTLVSAAGKKAGRTVTIEILE